MDTRRNIKNSTELKNLREQFAHVFSGDHPVEVISITFTLANGSIRVLPLVAIRDYKKHGHSSPVTTNFDYSLVERMMLENGISELRVSLSNIPDELPEIRFSLDSEAGA